MKPNNKIAAVAVAVILGMGGAVAIDQTQAVVPLDCVLQEAPIQNIDKVMREYRIDEGFLVTREMTPQDRGSIKGCEIAKIAVKEKVQREGLEIEIVDVEPIENGVQVFARAWTGSEPLDVYEATALELPDVTYAGKRLIRTIPPHTQIGFGPDGTVDIERFRIFNPPVLVEDSKGEIEKEFVLDDDPITKEKITEKKYYIVDHNEALLQVLEHNISVMTLKGGPEKIVVGKRGNTTSTFYPTAGSTAPMDMDLEGGCYTDTGCNTWANAYGDDGVVAGITNKVTQQTQTNLQARLRAWTNTNGWLLIYRNTMGFPTSAIGSDTISSATLSVYVLNKSDVFSQSVVVDKHTPTNPADIPIEDYATANFASVDQSGRTTVASVTTSAYNDFTLNATGIGNINKAGNSYFGIRMSGDMDNTAPTWASNTSAIVNWSSADHTGTTQDPKLVVEHAASVSRRVINIQ